MMKKKIKAPTIDETLAIYKAPKEIKEFAKKSGMPNYAMYCYYRFMEYQKHKKS